LVEQNGDAINNAVLFVLAKLHPIRMHQNTTVSSDPSARTFELATLRC
jgi:hypothetical protein